MDKYIGKRLDGRYEIRELIGVGGMAYVYKAYDTIDDRIVAVKILKDGFLANEEFTRRFKNESKAIAILSHPNIVKVYDVSFGDRLQYIVMEYIDGITLKEYIDQQKDIRWKEAVHFTVQILRALQHAHDKGIVHRDIKPQNIMLLPDGTISGTGMNSLNHYAYGSVMEYVYAHLAGLRPGSHGFRDAVLAPEPNLRLGHLDCTCLTPAGRYRCAWAIGTDGQLSVHLEIPFGCTASVTLPGSGRAPFPLAAGVYDYRYRPEADYRAVYHMDTRLSQLSGDPEAEELLRSALPQLFGILKEGNREFTTQTFRELSQAFYLGLNPENVSAAVQTLSGLLRAPGWDPEA